MALRKFCHHWLALPSIFLLLFPHGRAWCISFHRNSEQRSCHDGLRAFASFFESLELQQFSATTTEQNRHFIGTALAKEGAFYLHIENPIIKTLNDVILRNKDFVNAIENHFRTAFLRRLMEDPVLKDAIRYSDYKTMRFVFAEDSPLIRERLRQVYSRASGEFAAAMRREMARNPELNRAVLQAGGLAAHPQSWHLAGIHRDHRVAELLARLARHEFDPSNPQWIPIQENTVGRLGDELARAERFIALFGIPSPAMIEIVRSVPSFGRGREARLAWQRYVRTEILDHIGIHVSHEYLAALHDYFPLIDLFTPSALNEQRTPLNLHNERHGIVSIDFRGLGARNWIATARGISSALAARGHEAHGNTAEERVLSAVRHIQQEIGSVDREMGKLKQEVLQAAYDAGILQLNTHQQAELRAGTLDSSSDSVMAQVRFSGDDGILLPNHPISEGQRRAFLRNLTNGNRLRITFHDSGPTSTDIVAAEKIEKAMRQRLNGHPAEGGAHVQDLDLLMLGIQVTRTARGERLVSVLAESTDPFRPIPRHILERLPYVLRIVLPEGYTPAENVPIRIRNRRTVPARL